MDILENLCASNDIIRKVNGQLTRWYKLCVNYISNKGLIARIYKEHLQPGNKNTTQLKYGQRIDLSRVLASAPSQVWWRDGAGPWWGERNPGHRVGSSPLNSTLQAPFPFCVRVGHPPRRMGFNLCQASEPLGLLLCGLPHWCAPAAGTSEEGGGIASLKPWHFSKQNEWLQLLISLGLRPGNCIWFHIDKALF